MNTALIKKISSIALKIVALLLVVFSVFMMIFTIVSVTTVDRNDRNILGFKFYIVQTDSMSLSENNKDMDVHFNAGDIVLIKNVKDPTALQPGDVIAFMSTNGDDSYGKTITHMIRDVKKSANDKVIGYVTYGTNTGTDDEALVEPSYVIGKYTGKLPKLGHFFAFMKTTPGYITCILVPFLLLILYNGVNVIRLFRKYRAEQIEAMETEKATIAAEKAQNEEMLRQIMALKAELEQRNQVAPPTNTVVAEKTEVEAAVNEVAATEETTADKVVETEAETADKAE